MFAFLRERNGPATRERILSVIRSQPGLNKSQLCRATGLAWGTVGYHLRVLEREARIFLTGRGTRVMAFPFHMDPLHATWLATLRDEGAMKVLEALAKEPWQGVTELSLALGLSEKVVRRHLHQMHGEGLLDRRGEFRQRYQPTGRVHDLLETYHLKPTNAPEGPDLQKGHGPGPHL